MEKYGNFLLAQNGLKLTFFARLHEALSPDVCIERTGDIATDFSAYLCCVTLVGNGSSSISFSVLANS